MGILVTGNNMGIMRDLSYWDMTGYYCISRSWDMNGFLEGFLVISWDFMRFKVEYACW